MNDKISNEFNNRVWYPMYRINIFTDSMLKIVFTCKSTISKRKFKCRYYQIDILFENDRIYA